MARQPNVSVENNFTGGLKTEFTGLNFPENAATDTDNCVFNRIGNVTRRLGFDFESNYTSHGMNFTGNAISSFKWENVGGDGRVKILVQQIGSTLHFFKYSSASVAAPLSSQKLAATIDLSNFIVSGGSVDVSAECQYAAGNGFLFVFNPKLDPFFCEYTAGTEIITGTRVNLKVRDTEGVEDGFEDQFRSPTGTFEHNYNLKNQGWYDTPTWAATSSTPNTTTFGNHTWTVEAGLPIVGGQIAVFTGRITSAGPGSSFTVTESGTVVGYIGTSLTINVQSTSLPSGGVIISDWSFERALGNKAAIFQTATGLVPSNADIWWYFKNTSGIYDPATTAASITLGGPAPKGYFILDAFNQDRSSVSGEPTLIVKTTNNRPKTGTWFQGRVWYVGADASPFTENIYFSQVIERKNQFGRCYQTNDPTSEERFDLLPTDGGVIKIQGCGSIYKLFVIQNGLLVFADNGVWFITGSQGIGFAANDYTVTKISSIRSISPTSFVDVNGLPIFWNEEGIYTVSPAQQGGGPGERIAGLSVNSLTLPTIASFYESIPLVSKKYARGDYDPLNYTVQWLYKSTSTTDVTSRYQFDKILNFNTSTQAFYPWTVSTGTGVTPHVNGVAYIPEPEGGTDLNSVFKYVTTFTSGIEQLTFSEEKDTTYKDWETQLDGIDYLSYFVTGYKLHGQAQRKFQPTYVYMFSNNEEDTSYKIQGIWNYANSGNSGKFSSTQQVTNDTDNFDRLYRRHKIRGHGVVLQLKVTSATGKSFDIMGWSIYETINSGV